MLDALFHNCPSNAAGLMEPNDYAREIWSILSRHTYRDGKQGCTDARTILKERDIELSQMTTTSIGNMNLERMTDSELLEQTKAARRASHDAPLARTSDENKGGKPTGKRFISDHTNAWAMRSREWCRLADEVDRRGLVQPVMDWDGDSRR
jgi:hypothetical protein